MADQSQHLRRRRRLFRQARPTRQGRRLPPLRLRQRWTGGDWQHVLGTVQAYTVFVHPKDPETVLAGTNDGVWRSTDRGATFERTNFPDTKKQSGRFLVDSRDPERIFAGASPIDVYRSDDGGTSWRKLATPGIAESLQGPVRRPA